MKSPRSIFCIISTVIPLFFNVSSQSLRYDLPIGNPVPSGRCDVLCSGHVRISPIHWVPTHLRSHVAAGSAWHVTITRSPSRLISANGGKVKSGQPTAAATLQSHVDKRKWKLTTFQFKDTYWSHFSSLSSFHSPVPFPRLALQLNSSSLLGVICPEEASWSMVMKHCDSTTKFAAVVSDKNTSYKSTLFSLNSLPNKPLTAVPQCKKTFTDVGHLWTKQTAIIQRRGKQTTCVRSARSATRYIS